MRNIHCELLICVIVIATHASSRAQSPNPTAASAASPSSSDAHSVELERKLEANLVIPFTGATVRHGEAAFLLSNCNLCTCNDGTGKRGPEQVDVLIDGIAGDSWVAELFDKLQRV